MRNQSPNKLEKIAKIRTTKNYTKTSKEDSIPPLQKSKQIFAELYSNNSDSDNDRIKGFKESLLMIK